MGIKENLENYNKHIPEHVKLVAVSKTKPISDLLVAYECGQRIFGENKVQELTDKQPQLPTDIDWHFIGHLQSNKVKYIAPFVNLIHSVDSLKLLKEINKQAMKNNRVINCLLQFHIASEKSKFGLDMEEVSQILNSEIFASLSNVNIIGVMGMATFTNNETVVREEFKHLKNIFDILKKEFFKNDHEFKEISMGMSDDYKIAIAEGSTLVRIGSAIFGARNYT